MISQMKAAVINMKLNIAPLAACQRPSRDFEITVCKTPLPAAEIRVTDVPFNCWWPGHQRPINQTELASYATLDFEGKIDFEITVLKNDIERVEIRPRDYGIVPEINGNKIRFSIDTPKQFTVEVNGFHKALHIFANPIEEFEINENDENVIYFAPGVHKADLIIPKDNETVYFAPGAYVYGAIFIYKAKNVKILGRGVLDSSPYVRNEEYKKGELGGKLGGELIDGVINAGYPPRYGGWIGNICAVTCENLTIDGIILTDPPFWSMNIRENCENVLINNLKLLGLWRYNADGIDICTCNHVTISNCFIRSFDDSIITRGVTSRFEKDEFYDMKVENCVLWCEWGRAAEFWTCKSVSHISDVSYKNTHIIHGAHIAIDLQVYNGGPTYMKNISFTDMSFETDFPNDRPIYQHCDEQLYEKRSDDDYMPDLLHVEASYQLEAPVNGDGFPCDINFENVSFKNIRCYARKMPHSVIRTVDKYVKIKKFVFEDIYFNGKKLKNAEEMNMYIAKGEENVIIK